MRGTAPALKLPRCTRTRARARCISPSAVCVPSGAFNCNPGRPRRSNCASLRKSLPITTLKSMRSSRSREHMMCRLAGRQTIFDCAEHCRSRPDHAGNSDYLCGAFDDAEVPLRCGAEDLQGSLVRGAIVGGERFFKAFEFHNDGPLLQS